MGESPMARIAMLMARFGERGPERSATLKLLADEGGQSNRYRNSRRVHVEPCLQKTGWGGIDGLYVGRCLSRSGERDARSRRERCRDTQTQRAAPVLHGRISQ